MIKGMMLDWYGSFGGTYTGGQFGTLIDQWEQMGVFSYMIPFLLIFAVVYGILTKMKLFGDEKNKTIDGIIALGVALLAIQFEVVPIFFSDIFPRLGIAMAGVLVFIILMGLFANKDNKALHSTLMWSSFGIAILIILQSTEMFRYSSSDLLGFIPGEWIPMIALIVMMVIVLLSAKKQTTESPNSIFSRGLGAGTGNS